MIPSYFGNYKQIISTKLILCVPKIHVKCKIMYLKYTMMSGKKLKYSIKIFHQN